MTFEYPFAFLALVFLPLFWWLGRTASLRIAENRKLFRLFARMGVFILLVLALTDPRWLGKTSQQQILWLLDYSKSTDGTAAAAVKPLVDGLNKLDAKNTFRAFAGTSHVLAGLPTDSTPDPMKNAASATNIEEALQFAQANFSPGYVKTIVLVSDGIETRGDVKSLLPYLKRADVRIHVILTKGKDKPEVLVRTVDAPREVRSQEPFKVRAGIFSNRETPAEISIFKNGVRLGAFQKSLKAGENSFEFDQMLKGDERYSEFTVEVKSGNDTIADNNRLSTVVSGIGQSKILLLSDKPDSSRQLAWALKQEGILLDTRSAKGAPTNLADLQNYDLIILDNVPATDLSPDQMALMASYVKDFSGGFLMTGGDQSFGLGGYFRTPIEEILPVRCDFQKDKDTPSLGLVFIIDRSGSMEGDKMEMAKEAAKSALDLLSPKDYVGVVAFDNEAFWVADLESAANKSSTAQKISGIEAGGGTNIAPGMEMAYRAMASSPAKIRHVILLTDGVSTPGPFYELATQMAAEHITVTTVGIGSDADTQLLQQIASWGNGRFYFTDNPQSIPQIFAKETMSAAKSSIAESPFVPVVLKRADFLSGIDFSSAPYLLGYVRTEAKPTSEIWIATEDGKPLLATWRYGLGKTGAWTSDARNRWAVEWLAWPEFGKFWAQVARSLMRSTQSSRFPTHVESRGDAFLISSDGVDAAGRVISGMKVNALMNLPDGSRREVTLQEPLPGKYEMEFNPEIAGNTFIKLIFTKAGEVLEQQELSISASYPKEYQLQPPREDLLRRIAEDTGGKYGATPEDILHDTRIAMREIALWPWLVAAAAFLFPADVALRRIQSKLSGPPLYSSRISSATSQKNPEKVPVNNL